MKPHCFTLSSLQSFTPSSFQAFTLLSFQPFYPSALKLSSSEAFEPTSVQAIKPSGLNAFKPSSLRAFSSSICMVSKKKKKEDERPLSKQAPCLDGGLFLFVKEVNRCIIFLPKLQRDQSKLTIDQCHQR
jgi:hypothetical protein